VLAINLDIGNVVLENGGDIDLDRIRHVGLDGGDVFFIFILSLGNRLEDGFCRAGVAMRIRRSGLVVIVDGSVI
jgi:hypothetical protein